ncbi:MAG TPA: hypothetical protein VM307_00700 [Egibacteraceae bacterium]|nr:hypothetical protein [Egibacteraceae bacterium]
MTRPGHDLDDYAAAWQALSRRDRSTLVRNTNAGRKGETRWDAAMMLWLTQRELRRGPWPGFKLAVAFVVGILLFLWVVNGIPPYDLAGVLAVAPLLPVLVLIPFAAFSFRRQRLQRSAQLNAALLTDKGLDGPLEPGQAERLLVRARNKGWFKGSRPRPSA